MGATDVCCHGLLGHLPQRRRMQGRGFVLQILLLGHTLPQEGCSYMHSMGQFLRSPGTCSPLALLPVSSGTPLAKGTNSQTVPAATHHSPAKQTRDSGRMRTAAQSAVPAPPPPPTRKTGSSATAATVSSSATTRPRLLPQAATTLRSERSCVLASPKGKRSCHRN